MQTAIDKSLPLLILDACHLKGPDKGIINIATVVTGNNEHLLVGFAVQSCTECEESWTWFLGNMTKSMPSLINKIMVVMSDRDKGLMNACACSFRGGHHSFCSVHLKRNVKAHFKTELDGRIHMLATTLDSAQAKKHWDYIGEIDTQAVKYLANLGLGTWMSLHSPLPRYGIVTSNPAEITNSWLKYARTKPFFGCLAEITDRVRKRVFDLRQHHRERKDSEQIMNPGLRTKALCPFAKKKVTHNLRTGRMRIVKPSSDFVFSVSSSTPGIDRVVNLDKKDCSCGWWREFGIPCVHACAALHFRHSMCIRLRENNPYLYTSDLFQQDTVDAIYEQSVFPVDLPKLNPQQTTKPSTFKKSSSGRPKKKHFKSRGE